jgi:ribosomal protein L16/L10AE
MDTNKAPVPPEKIMAKIHALKEKKGTIVVINPETGDYFLGKTLTEALKKAKKKFPGKIFYSIRRGYSFIYEHKGGIKKI